MALRDYLENLAPKLHARIIVCAGHIHNYERFSQHGVIYLVSGGGGASPVPVERTPMIFTGPRIFRISIT